MLKRYTIDINLTQYEQIKKYSQQVQWLHILNMTTSLTKN
jgi:hypothetical protein